MKTTTTVTAVSTATHHLILLSLLLTGSADDQSESCSGTKTSYSTQSLGSCVTGAPDRQQTGYGLTEVGMKNMIAMAVNGVPAYGPMESDNLNAVEVTDSDKTGAAYWYGHASSNNAWHVHNPHMGKETVTSDDLLGYSLDGFPIYGVYDDATLLDDCNGITNADGSYQYHVRSLDQIDETLEYCNGDSPATNWNYILGCYTGSLANTAVYDSTSYTLPSDCVVESTTSAPTKSPTTSPTTSAPTTSPTKSPTTSPTTSAPTTSPTTSPTTTTTTEASCPTRPSPSRNGTRATGVVENDKCGKKKFWSHCRSSCDKCNKCTDSKQKLKMSTEVTITWEKDGETVTKTKTKFKCTKVAKADNADDICNEYNDVALSCPSTCGLCS
eukprot:jgi/Psemu1/293732/fgenesh1_pg.3548_\